MKPIKWLVIGLSILIILFLGAFFYFYSSLSASLPEIDGVRQSNALSAQGTIERDKLGTAIIHASSRLDMAYLIGFAHAQDRFFQMDTLRRSSAGELSELVGDATLALDKRARFHQFRARAVRFFSQLDNEQQMLLEQYAKGVNDAIAEFEKPPFEYLLTQSEIKPWKPEDSLLASYSMYMDLQGWQIERDFAFTALEKLYGAEMVQFFTLPSEYQAALDGSKIPMPEVRVPALERQTDLVFTDKTLRKDSGFDFSDIPEPADIGSNNWAVTGRLTDTESALLSNDMHLSLRVPPIWYRAQLNYSHQGQDISVTGVSLPGTPAIIVGSNSHIAWGFTNANLDNLEWIELQDDTSVEVISENIMVKNKAHNFDILMSEYGPVREMMGKRYALIWVAHQPYGINIEIAELAHKKTTEEALTVSTLAGMPVQNMMVVDRVGNAAWKPTGAVTARQVPSTVAINEQAYTSLWKQQEQNVPSVSNPIHGRLWTANDRIISTQDLPRYGNGGYALGARGLQIKKRLFEHETFDESTFYAIQLDNQANFLSKWHELLLNTLKTKNKIESDSNPSENGGRFDADIAILNDWKACACEDSIGYTLVRRFRSSFINMLLEPIETNLKSHEINSRPLLTGFETSVWHILNLQAQSWLHEDFSSFDEMLAGAYERTKERLIERYKADPITLEGLEWGEVNKLEIKHPIAQNLPIFHSLFHMRSVQGFGDSFMPAVQRKRSGASQRLIVRPGNEDLAILTVPGGQSGHPLSDYFRTGFEDYALGENTPLLPSEPIHSLVFSPKE